MPTIDDYLALITSYHRGKPKFAASLTAAVQPLVDLQNLLAELPADFDLDVAIGAQLDVVGQWIGRSRNIPVPIAGLWFTFDDPLRGFDRGIWKGPYDTGNALSRLDDDTYRRLLRAKILANSWDGTTAGAQAILDAFFVDPDTHIFVVDGGIVLLDEGWFSFDDAQRGFDAGAWQPADATVDIPPVDMTMTIGVSGKIPSILDLTLLGQNYLPIRPAGVTVNYAVTSVDETPVFGFDVDNEFIGGFEAGSWGVTPDYIATHAV